MKYKKHVIMPAAILAYAVIMTVFTYRQTGQWTERMTITILIEVAITILLYILLKKKYNDMDK